MDKIRNTIDINRKKRNYGKRVDGAWVFGLVLQKISEIEELSREKKNEFKDQCKSKEKRKNMHKDGRILNTRENHLYDLIAKRKYESKITEKTEEKIKEVRMFIVKRRDAKTLIPIINRNIYPI